MKVALNDLKPVFLLNGELCFSEEFINLDKGSHIFFIP